MFSEGAIAFTEMIKISRASEIDFDLKVFFSFEVFRGISKLEAFQN
jgi:hypothetical protein